MKFKPGAEGAAVSEDPSVVRQVTGFLGKALERVRPDYSLAKPMMLMVYLR